MKNIFLLFLLCNIAYAQVSSHRISWDTHKLISNGTTQESFKEAAYLYDDAIPQYQHMIKIAGNKADAVFSNYVFEPFDNQNIDKSKLSSTITFETDVVCIQKEYYLSIYGIPLRLNPITGSVEKLTSFNINLSTNNVFSHKSTKATKPNSVLSSGKWYKISVPTDGVYKIDYNFLESNNITTGNINFSNFGVFGQAMGMLPDANSAPRIDDLEEIEIKIIDNNNDGFWNQSDYVLFYGKGPDVWQYANGDYDFTKNYFTDKAGYFITTNRGSGGYMPQVPSLTVNATSYNTYDYLNVFEEELYNLIYTELHTTMGSGREWFGQKLNNYSNVYEIELTIPNISNSSPASIHVGVAARSANSPSTFSVNHNGNTIGNLTVVNVGGGNYPPAAKFSKNSFVTNLSANNTFQIAYANNGDAQATGYIDYLRIHAKANLQMNDNVLFFRNADAIGSNTRFTLSNANSTTEIWDITKGSEVFKITGNLSGNQYTINVSMDSLRQFVAVNTQSTSFNAPNFESEVSNQNLHHLAQHDFFIITNQDLTSSAQRLAAFHRNEGMSVAVVDINEIYNEFSSGMQDITAIRDFLKMFYDRATSYNDMPKYVLFFGDASFDYKGIVDASNNIVPTYESYNSFSQINSYCTDDYFGFLDNGEGEDIESINSSNRLDIAIGRIPVVTSTSADAVVDKIINYNSANTMRDWRNNLCFVADDGDNNLHFNQVENLIALPTIENKNYYNFEKIYLDAYTQENAAGGDRYPDVNDAILRKIRTGAFLINYTGHGGIKNWAQERVFNIDDIRTLKNKDKLPLFITATCDFSPYDDIDFHSAGETLLTNGEGGAIAILTTTRVVYAHENFLMNSQVLNYLFQNYQGRKPTVGEVVLQSKNAATQSTNNRKFVLLGDPALTLAYPEYRAVTTVVNGQPVSQIDTLKALEHIRIEGEIQNASGALLQQFNGVVYPTVYDKKATYQTKGQDADSQEAPFELRNNILFKGKASVVNGKFSYEFIVPKDINYAFDYGKISYYAANNLATQDAHGYSYDIIVGGTSDQVVEDNAGPKVDVYMNDSTFAFGGLTDENPLLYVKLNDESGINTVGNGVGHDIIGLLNENTQEQYLLNEYYEATLDDFRKGYVEYPFNKLEDGRYSVRVKAWDVHNNPGEGYTEFIVASSAEIALRNVLNYPNPFTTHTSFIFEHNRPGEILDVNVQIYTISGKLIKNINETITGNGFRVAPNEITWNGLDEYGDLIGKGVYIYKVNVKGESGFAAQEFQKLVILH